MEASIATARSVCNAHVDTLRLRGIPADVAAKYGLHEYDGQRLRQLRKDYHVDPYPGLGAHQTTGIVIPYPIASESSSDPSATWDGRHATYWRVRSDHTSVEVEVEGESSSAAKRTVEIPRYFACTGEVRPYLTWGVFRSSNDTTTPIVVTEAPLKALAIEAVTGLPAIGLGGVLAGIHDAIEARATGEILAHHDLKGRVDWRGRRVYIAYDAGIKDNALVALGAAYVWAALAREGADVWVVRVPFYHPSDSDPERGILYDTKDQGPDDYLARHGAPDDMPRAKAAWDRLVAEAVPADPAARIAHALGALQGVERLRVLGDLLADLAFLACCHIGGDLVGQQVVAASGRSLAGKTLKGALNEFREKLSSKSKAEAPAWEGRLYTTSSGVRRPIRENVELCLRNDEKLKGLLAYDSFACRMTMRRNPPWSRTDVVNESLHWTDADDLRLAGYMAEKYEILDVPSPKIRGAVEVVSRENSFHPVREYLEGLSWDTTDRVDTWLSRYFGVEDTPYTRFVGRAWLISAVARALKPGVKVDHVLVLEGLQGPGKSSALEVLGGEWFSAANLGDLQNKESVLALQGSWIHELAEGEIFTRAGFRALKGFLTTRDDDVVLKFSNLRTRFPRQCVHALTINESDDYLQDEENRRYWPVAVTAIDLAALREDRDQLWAEALVLYRAGVLWYPSTIEERAMCAHEQAARQTQDDWFDSIADGVAPFEEVTIAELLVNTLKIPAERQNQSHRRRIGRVLRQLGWSQDTSRSGGSRLWKRGPEAGPKRDAPETGLRLVYSSTDEATFKELIDGV